MDPAQKEISPACQENYRTAYEEHLEELLTDLRDSNYVFHPQLRNYFTELIQRIARANQIDIDPLVLLRRTQRANATSMGDGVFTVYLGLLQGLATEESLAFVLCHELAHDQLQHSHENLIEHCHRELSLKDVRQRLTRQRVLRNRNRRLALTNALRSRVYTSFRQRRANELAADSLGLVYYRQMQLSLAGPRKALAGLANKELAHLNNVDFVSLLATEEYPVKKRWLEPTNVLFGGSFGSEDNPDLGFWQADSVATHPNLEERIQRMDSVLFLLVIDSTLRENRHDWQELAELELIRAQLEAGVTGLAFVNALRLLQAAPERTDLQALVGKSLLMTYQSIEDHDFDQAVPYPAYFREANARKAVRMLRGMRKSELEKLTLAYLSERSLSMPQAVELNRVLRTAEDYFSTLD